MRFFVYSFIPHGNAFSWRRLVWRGRINEGKGKNGLRSDFLPKKKNRTEPVAILCWTEPDQFKCKSGWSRQSNCVLTRSIYRFRLLGLRPFAYFINTTQDKSNPNSNYLSPNHRILTAFFEYLEKRTKETCSRELVYGNYIPHHQIPVLETLQLISQMQWIKRKQWIIRKQCPEKKWQRIKRKE